MKSNPDEFQIFVKPVGGRCNLICDYCYYRKSIDQQVSTVMDRNLLELYIQQHFRSSAEEILFFSWHGGEPMLAGIDFFSEVVSLQSRHNYKGVKVINGIQTNGTLIDNRWAEFFSKHDFFIGLSLDGPDSLHNHFRKDPKGEVTHNSVMRAWEILKEHGIKNEILCVVNSLNVERPDEIYNFFMINGAQHLSFIPLVERVGTTDVSSRTVDPKRYGEFLIKIFDKWKLNGIGKVKIQIFEEALRSAFGQEHTLCIFRKTCGRVPVLEVNGNFYTCDHYVNNENLVGNINNSTLRDLLNNDIQKDFGREKESLPQYCRDCEVLDMCNGGCPRNRFIKTPEGEPGLNYLCSGYRSFFTHCKPFTEEVAKVWRMKQ